MTKGSALCSAILLLSGFGLQWFVEASRSAGMNIILSSAPNFISAAFFGTVLALCFGKGEFRTSASFSLGLFLYEILQLIFPDRTFDIMDIAATALGLLVSFCMLFCYKQIGKKRQLNAET